METVNLGKLDLAELGLLQRLLDANFFENFSANRGLGKNSKAIFVGLDVKIVYLDLAKAKGGTETIFVAFALCGDDQDILSFGQEVKIFVFLEEDIQRSSIAVGQADKGEFLAVLSLGFERVNLGFVGPEDALEGDDGLWGLDQKVAWVFQFVKDDLISNLLSPIRQIIGFYKADQLVLLMLVDIYAQNTLLFIPF